MSTTISNYPYLTDDEILALTKPLVQPAAIVRWFRSNGFDALKIRPNGMPLINRTHFDAVTSYVPPQKNTVHPTHSPDSAALIAAISRKAKQAC
jgi:hypothetical protein